MTDRQQEKSKKEDQIGLLMPTPAQSFAIETPVSDNLTENGIRGAKRFIAIAMLVLSALLGTWLVWVAVSKQWNSSSSSSQSSSTLPAGEDVNDPFLPWTPEMGPPTIERNPFTINPFWIDKSNESQAWSNWIPKNGINSTTGVMATPTCAESPDRWVVTIMRPDVWDWDFLHAMPSRFNLNLTTQEEYEPRKYVTWFWINYLSAERLKYRLVFAHNKGLFAPGITANLTTECVSFYEYNKTDFWIFGTSPPINWNIRNAYTMRYIFVWHYIQWAQQNEVSLLGRLPRFIGHHDLDAHCFRNPSEAFQRWPLQVIQIISHLLIPPVSNTYANTAIYMQWQYDKCIRPLSLGTGGLELSSAEASVLESSGMIASYEKKMNWYNTTDHLLELTSAAFSGRAFALKPLLQYIELVSLNMTNPFEVCDMAMLTQAIRWSGALIANRSFSHFVYTPMPLQPIPSSSLSNMRRDTKRSYSLPVNIASRADQLVTCPVSAACEPVPLSDLPATSLVEDGTRKTKLEDVEWEFPSGHARGLGISIDTCFAALTKKHNPTDIKPYYIQYMIPTC